ncbi:hypothetical protein MYMA111404_00075 [Mycoplasma marinum]|uniref:Uncharacterized protein n=1 Tax=Mycoplasma marinum TaxID=1937190 RepID=A0A4V2NI68_9MOLU|nr:hypothetical protein [Mycoplasma marinum]TCG11701.1 hypothetical protein C4B24_00920 [Mycoplasma marinum]
MKIQIIITSINSNYFDVDNNIKVIKSPEYNILNKIIDAKDMININNFKQNSTGNFTFVENQDMKLLRKYIKFNFSVNGSDFSPVLLQNILPGSKISIKLSSLFNKAIIVKDSDMASVKVFNSEQIIKDSVIESIVERKFELLGFNSNATLSIPEDEWNYINKNHIKVFITVNGRLANTEIINDMKTSLNISNGDKIQITFKPDSHFFFEDGSKQLLKNITVKDLESKDISIVYYAIISFIAVFVVALLSWILAKKIRGK